MDGPLKLGQLQLPREHLNEKSREVSEEGFYFALRLEITLLGGATKGLEAYKTFID